MVIFRLLEKHNNLFVAFLLLSFLILLGGCTFGSQGLGQGFSQHGIYCIRGSVKFTPTPTSIAGGPSDGPAFPVSDEDCEDLANGFGSSWKFSKVGDPESVLTWTKWDIYDAVLFSDGINYCLLKVYVPSATVLEKGLGEWQAEFTLGNWSVTCPVREIVYCAEDDHQAHELTIFNATQHVDSCEIGVEEIFEVGTLVPYPE